MKPVWRARLLATAVAGLLGVVAASPARAEEIKNSSKPSPFSLKYLMVPAVVGMSRPLELKELNRALSAADIPELPLYLMSASLSVAAVLESGIVLEPRYRMSIGASAQAVFMTHHMLLDVGYIVVQRGEALVYPWVGIGLGNAGLELTYEGVTPKSFEAVLAEPVGDAFLSSSALVLHTGMAVNLWGSGHGDFVGIRTGFIWAPPDTGWKRRNVTVYGGPPAPLSQAYLAIALGFDTRPR